MLDMDHVRRNIDYPLLFSYVVISVVGILLIYSATYYAEAEYLKTLYRRQAVWFAVSVGVVFLTAVLPYKYWFFFSYVLYTIGLLLLIIMIVFSGTSLVNDRWLVIGSLRLQPSEFAKIATVLMLARYVTETRLTFTRPADFLVPALIVMMPAMLVARQPDLGTALVFIGMLLPVYFWAGMRTVYLIYIIFPVLNVITSFNWISWMIFMIILMGVLVLTRPSLMLTAGIFIGNLVIGIATPHLWNQLHDYQKQRILTFVNPEQDPLGAGYQIIQSKVAVGSGGIVGKGYLKGTQTQLAFLPEQHTDFIFSVLGEEFGFLGVTLVMGLLFFIIYRGMAAAASCHNRFASFMCVGFVTIIFFHVVVNLGMVVGLMPVTGLPLPFLSYGGSSFLSFSIMVGLMLGIMIRKWEY